MNFTNIQLCNRFLERVQLFYMHQIRTNKIQYLNKLCGCLHKFHKFHLKISYIKNCVILKLGIQGKGHKNVKEQGIRICHDNGITMPWQRHDNSIHTLPYHNKIITENMKLFTLSYSYVLQSSLCLTKFCFELDITNFY